MGSQTAFSPGTLFTDFAVVSALLIAGQLLRARIRFLRAWLIPSALIAGALALAAGPNGLAWLPLSAQVRAYPEMLVVLIFAALPFGAVLGGRDGVKREVGEMFCHVTFGILAQYGWGMLLGLLALRAFWDVYPGFGFVLGIGFWGGPGTTAAAASGFEAYGWPDALTLGLTAWMIGVLVAIFVGTLILNIQARRGGLENAGTVAPAARGSASGAAPQAEKVPVGWKTVSGASMESLTLHLALVFSIALAGWLGSERLRELWSGPSIPAFGLALITGFLLRPVLRAAGADAYVDRATIRSISGTATDYLIVVGMAAIEAPRVVQYAAPLAALLAFGVLLSLFQALALGPRMFGRYWFEKSILVFGMNTGTLAQGIMLLRIADPEMRSDALGVYGIVDLAIKPITLGMVVVGPVLIGNGYALPFAMACSALAFAPLAAARAAGWWRRA